jgi:transcription-repair coupling factor
MNIPRISVLQDLWSAVEKDKQIEAPTLPESILPLFLAGLPISESGRPIVVVLVERSTITLPGISRSIAFWKQVKIGETEYPTNYPLTILPVLLPQERSGDIPTPRLRAYWQAITALKNNHPRLILATQKELQQPSPKLTSDLGVLQLKEKQTLSPTILIEKLINFGYTEERVSEEPATFSHHGGIVDIFPFHSDAPMRIEFLGNEIDHIKSLAPRNSNNNDTNKIFERISQTDGRTRNIFPLALPPTLPVNFQKIIESAYIVAEEGALIGNTTKPDMLLQPFSGISEIREPAPCGGDMEKFKLLISETLKKNKVIILTARPEATRVTLPQNENLEIIPAETAADARGFINTKDAFAIFTDADIGESAEEDPLSWDSGMAYSRRFSAGGYVVHRDHGIARFRGIERKELRDSARDYLVLEYAASDKLFVPVEMSYKVTAYIGAANPVIHRLGGSEWESTTKEIRQETADLAKELLQLYAARETQSGTAFPPETEAERSLADSFPYDETHDQETAIREVTKDMERAQPMDRLVCGDVGFGKTEVAIRAAFKSVNFGRQVAVLSPTTLLAQQHFDTFQERLKPFNSRCALISRFQTASEQNEVVRKLVTGEVDIVIGTHRLLSEDVKFKSLGLMIIDEEQKFGVEQKESLRRMRASVDVLSLSATPIPRTLNMALSGLRSLSVIATPPGGRQPVITKVTRENDELVKKALQTELERGGQAYVLWNRVETIEAAAERIRKIMPKARVVVGHGQMHEQKLMEVMELFDTKKADILVCSTIIQNGIDLPNVNTLVVFDSPSFGLSDLYQLRGRVGRGNKQAFAYFLYHQGRLPFEARKRLTALLEAVELGSGWTLALRDLEIRGAGNLLGKEQHGTIKAVGVHLFGELLNEEVERLRKGQAEQTITDVQIDLPIKAYLPEEYIPNTAERLQAYTRTGSIRSMKDLVSTRHALEEQYGPLPEAGITFFQVLKLKLLAAIANVNGIVTSTNPMASKRDMTAQKDLRITLTLQDGLTPTIAYTAIADNPRWTFTGASMSIPVTELGQDYLSKVEHTLHLITEAREKERVTGKAKKKV